jgi:Protein of unknown function (DUF3558)
VRNRLPLVIATLGIVVVSGCTTTSAGTPLPDPSSETSTNTEPSSGEDLPSDGAPKVENPLDVSRFERKPCEALTAENAQALNLPTPGKQRSEAYGETCYWNNTKSRGSLALTFFSNDERGLSALYREAKGAKFPYFEPIDDIDGYPAAAYDTKSEKPTIDCAIGIGVSDQLAISVDIGLSDGNIGDRNPCEVATQAASMLLKTMREAA